MQPKYLRIADTLRHGIANGRYASGARLPSEAELTRRFKVSRMTVVKAMQYMQHQGLVVRRPGSGTYVAGNRDVLVFGLLIPDLGRAEIFDPICQAMVRTQQFRRHSFLWEQIPRGARAREEHATELCRHYIAQKVDGVFFAPLEFSPVGDDVNRTILESLDQAGIPVVLLDRCVVGFPLRGCYDLVGMDNMRAGYIAAQHLARQGARSIAFFIRHGAAETVQARVAGCREALQSWGQSLVAVVVIYGDYRDSGILESAIRAHGIDAFVCANDEVAAHLMYLLFELKYRVPEDVRLVGFDDVRYARLMPVPLSTVRQPCADIGWASIMAMMERIKDPSLPPRSILLNGRMVVRSSCGSSDALAEPAGFRAG